MDMPNRLSALDLEALRKAFKEEVREQNIPASDWSAFAKKFLEHRVGQEPGEEHAAQPKPRFQATFR
jgi:hypothetical protein